MNNGAKLVIKTDLANFFATNWTKWTTDLSFKDENTALAKIEWRGVWQLVLGRIVAIAPIDSTWWIDEGFGGDCHDLPSEALRSATAISKLLFRLRLRLHRVVDNMPSLMAVGKLIGIKVGLFLMICWHYIFLPRRWFFWGGKFVTKKEPCFLGKALDDAI